MAKSTPENKVKAAVKRVLSDHSLYGWWPVPFGYGENSLDFIGCMSRQFFAIETKAPGKKPTRNQLHTAARITRAGGTVFIIDSTDSPILQELERFLKTPRDPAWEGHVVEKEKA